MANVIPLSANCPSPYSYTQIKLLRAVSFNRPPLLSEALTRAESSFRRYPALAFSPGLSYPPSQRTNVPRYTHNVYNKHIYTMMYIV